LPFSSSLRAPAGENSGWKDDSPFGFSYSYFTPVRAVFGEWENLIQFICVSYCGIAGGISVKQDEKAVFSDIIFPQRKAS
jgi:hypothetical protein